MSVPIAVDRLVTEFGLSRDAAHELVQEVLSANLIKMFGNSYNSEAHHQYVEEYYKRRQAKSFLRYIFG